MMSDDEELLASAVRFLFETNDDESARMLLQCSLVSDSDDEEFWASHRYRLVAPTKVYLTLQNEKAATTRIIKGALSYVLPRGSFPFRNQLEIVAGYPDRDEKTQAELLRFARGEDATATVIEAPSSRKGASSMLITPLSIFPVEQFQRNPRLCFIIMPFAAAFDDIYTYGIKPAIEKAGLIPQRGDDILESGSILGHIWTSLLTASFVVADVTGANGNVLYELGLAHALGHSAILLTQDMRDVPFDLQQQRHIVYKATREAAETQLCPLLTAMLDHARAK